MNITGLIFGIVFRPSKTMDYIIAEKPLMVGMTIWIISAFLHIYALTAVISSVNANSATINWVYYLGIVLQPKNLFRIFGVFLYSYIQNMIATKYYKYGSHYIELLSCSLFILMIDNLERILIIIIASIGLVNLVNYFSIPFILWASYLTILAIMKVFDLTVKRGISIFVGSMAIMALILFVWKQII